MSLHEDSGWLAFLIGGDYHPQKAAYLIFRYVYNGNGDAKGDRLIPALEKPIGYVHPRCAKGRIFL
jgi:hypothetical protein